MLDSTTGRSDDSAFFEEFAEALGYSAATSGFGLVGCGTAGSLGCFYDCFGDSCFWGWGLLSSLLYFFGEGFMGTFWPKLGLGSYFCLA